MEEVPAGVQANCDIRTIQELLGHMHLSVRCPAGDGMDSVLAEAPPSMRLMSARSWSRPAAWPPAASAYVRRLDASDAGRGEWDFLLIRYFLLFVSGGPSPQNSPRGQMKSDLDKHGVRSRFSASQEA